MCEAEMRIVSEITLNGPAYGILRSDSVPAQKMERERRDIPFSWPWRRWRALLPDNPAALMKRMDGDPVRVLVVNDEPSLAELLANVLRYEGWEIQTAGDGRSAVRLAREFRPDAIVLDIMLPDFDGLEVLRRVRRDAPNVCVLFLTARDAVDDRVAGITAGGDDYGPSRSAWRKALARRRGPLRRAGIARGPRRQPSWWSAT